MGYDIPDKVKYREKIVFGLDGKQLVYAVLFGGGAVLAYGLPLTGELKLVLPSAIAISGIAFTFLGLEKHILARVAFARAQFLKRDKEKFTAKAIPVVKIERDAFILTNGELRAVLAVEPLNFALFDDDRKKSLVYNFREFLNHISYPAQIIVRTSRVELGDYFTQYAPEAIKDPSLTELYTDFGEHKTAFLSKSEVKERSYFLVICLPFPPSNIEKAFQKLDDHVAITKEKLLDTGIQSKRLENNELFPFIVSYFIAEERRVLHG